MPEMLMPPRSFTDLSDLPSRRLPVLALVWMAIGVFSLLAFLLVPSERALVGGFATTVVTIPLLGLRSTRFRWFHPLILASVTAVIGIGFRSWYLLYAENRPGARSLLLDTDPVDTVVLGTTVLGIGLGALVIGYVSLSQHRQSNVQVSLWGDWIASWGWTNVILIGSIAVGAIATLLYIQAIGGVTMDSLSSKRYIELESGAVSSGAFFSRAAAVPAIAALPVVARRARDVRVPVFTQALIVLCVLASMVAPFVGSSRAEIIAILIMVGIVWSARNSTISIRIVALGAGLLFIFLQMGSLRCEHQTGTSEGCSVSDQVEESLLANESWMSVTKTAHISSKVPQDVDFQYGRTFLTAFLAPIPRVVWSEKPTVRADNLVAQEILGLQRQNRPGAPPGIVGELYLNWSWPGVVGGMFLLGRFLRWLWEWHLRNQSDFAVAAFAVIVTHVALRLPAGDFVGSFLPTMQGLSILLFLKFAGSSVGPKVIARAGSATGAVEAR
jgi:oligosaccharide repeat unit polymerase